jgi:hypothetical protein
MYNFSHYSRDNVSLTNGFAFGQFISRELQETRS